MCERKAENMNRIIEVCCGSFSDAVQAAAGGAERIELNSALALGGLTPTVSVLSMIKVALPLKVIAMVRPRGAGFCYTGEEFRVMEAECRMLLDHGADGIAFGCLQADASLDLERNRRLAEMIHQAGGEAVFHRAFDCTDEPEAVMEQLIGLGVDRVLTSGQKPTAMEGKDLIQKLQRRYGAEIQILAGSGVNGGNARELMDYTGITQVHSSCKTWRTDPTTIHGEVSYSMASGEHAEMYDVVSAELVRDLIKCVTAEGDNYAKDRQ